MLRKVCLILCLVIAILSISILVYASEIAEYAMDQTSGTTVVDSSGTGNNASANGTTWTSGLIDGAIEFDGTNDYVTLPQSVANTTDFTFAAWVHWDGGSIWQRIFDFGSSTTSYMMLTPCGGIEEDNQKCIKFGIKDGDAAQMLTSENPITTDTWVHVAVTIDGDVGKLYINGELKDSNPNMTINPSDLSATTLYLGKSRFSADPYFNGKLDQVHIRNDALTDSEIMDLAKPLYAEYTFDNTSNDSSGNSNNATLNNGLSYVSTGHFKQALSFDGSNDYAQLPAAVNNTEDFTFTAWVNWDGGNAWQRIFDFGNGTQDFMFMTPKDNNDVFRFDIHVGAVTQTLSHSSALPTNEWVHVGITIKDDIGKLYINGEVVATNTSMTLDSNDISTVNAYLGKSQFGTDPYFDGKIDQVKIYSCAINALDMYELSRDKISQYSFDSTAADASEYGYDATVYNSSYSDGYNSTFDAFELNGSSSYAQLPTSVNNAEDFTFTAWVNWDGGNAWQRIFDFGNGTQDFMYLTPKDNNGVFRFDIHVGTTTQTLSHSSALPTNKWVQVGVTIKDDTGKLYLDGDVVATNTNMTLDPHDISTVNAYLGKSQFGIDPYFDGTIQQVSIFANALTQEDICKIQRDVIKFPQNDLDIEYVKGGDPAVIDEYDHWDYAFEHDGEIMKEGNYYYMFSTDCSYGNPTTPLRPAIQIRKSTDLIHWEFEGWVWDDVPQDAENWTGVDDMLWAPSVGKIGNTYYLYYSVSSLGTRKTYLGVATSSSLAGPWTDQGEVFKTLDNDPNYDVNPIDPNFFFDENGDPWLVYGSYYGGIYVNEINPNTGKFVTYGEGTCIARRTDAIDVTEADSIEGAFIVYNEPSDKYVLFVSYDHYYGDYNLRVGRSDSVDGSYVDYDGYDLTNTTRQSTTEVGYKILGTYKFDNHLGWWGLGHNAIYEENGDYYSLNNSHFLSDTGYSYLQMRKLLWTSDGWPILSPQRYAGEIEQTIPEKSVVGTWEQLIFMQQSKYMRATVDIEIRADGSFGSNSNNYWEFEGDNTLKMYWYDSSVQGNYYIDTLTVLPAWDWENWKPTLVFTGKNQFGVTVWGKNVDNIVERVNVE